MSQNIILLSGEEKLIRYLNTQNIELIEKREQGKISTITLTYYLLDNDDSLFRNIRQGMKLWVQGIKDLKDCLYVINESVKYTLGNPPSVEIQGEEILVELNYVPVVTQFDLRDENGVLERSVDLSVEVLDNWFGDWYNIRSFTPPLNQETISFTGSMSRMALLRLIEKETGNVFITSYQKRTNSNLIQRNLDFVRKEEQGTEQSQLLDLERNLENVDFSIEESDTYSRMSAAFDFSKSKGKSSSDILESSDEVRFRKGHNTLNNFYKLKVTRGTIIPRSFSEAIKSETYPTEKEGDMSVFYWRRTPKDSTYEDYSLPLSAAINMYSGFKISLFNNKKKLKKQKGKRYIARTDFPSVSVLTKEGEKLFHLNVADQLICNGKYWILVSKIKRDANDHLRVGKTEYVLADSSYHAPFQKDENTFYIEATAEETEINYELVGSRPDIDYEANDMSLGDIDEIVPSVELEDEAEPQYWTKCGRPPENIKDNVLCCIGTVSAAHDYKSGIKDSDGNLVRDNGLYYLGILERKCPYCGSTDLVWSWNWTHNLRKDGGYVKDDCYLYDVQHNKRIWKSNSIGGNVYCNHCDADWSMLGGSHEGDPNKRRHLKLLITPVHVTKKDAQNLKAGKYPFKKIW